MTKYIDSEKLIAEIERELSAHDKVDHLDSFEVGKAWNRGHRRALENILDFITSLQQERPEASKGKFNFPKFLYARTLDNKTIDISYAPQNMDAIEYVRNDFIEQEHPEVDLEKEYKEWWETRVSDNVNIEHTMEWFMHETARHFWNKGYKARKEEQI